MLDATISVPRLLTVAAWVVTVLLLVAAPMVAFWAHRPWLAVLLAETACVVSAVAAAMTVRCYISKLAVLVRTMAPADQGRRVRSLS